MLALMGVANAGSGGDARLRRGRRGHRRADRPRGRRAAARARRGPAGRVHHPPAADRLARDPALLDRQGPAGRPGAHHGDRARRRRPWSPRSCGCSAPTAATRRRGATRRSCSGRVGSAPCSTCGADATSPGSSTASSGCCAPTAHVRRHRGGGRGARRPDRARRRPRGLWSGYGAGGELSDVLAPAVAQWLIASPLVAAMTAHALCEMDEGRAATAGPAIQRGLDRFGTLLAAMVLVGLGVAVGLLAFVVPGLVMAVQWSVTAQAVAVENRSGRDALRRSRALVLGRGWWVFGVLLVVNIVGSVLSLVASVPADLLADATDSQAVALIGTVLGHLVAFPVMALGTALLFFSLRAAEEQPAAPPQAGRAAGRRAGPAGRRLAAQARRGLAPALGLTTPRLQLERGGVDAEALAAAVGRAVVEDVAEVAAAARADDLGADHAVGGVGPQLDGLGHGGLGEARPARARLETSSRRRTARAAAAAVVHAGGLLVGVAAGEGRLGRLAAEHGVALGVELGAPLLVGLLDLLHDRLLAARCLRGTRYASPLGVRGRRYRSARPTLVSRKALHGCKDPLHLRHRRRRLVPRKGDRRRLAGPPPRLPGADGRPPEVRPVHQRRSRGRCRRISTARSRHRGRRRDRPRPRPLRALHRRQHVARLERDGRRDLQHGHPARARAATTSARPSRSSRTSSTRSSSASA